MKSLIFAAGAGLAAVILALALGVSANGCKGSSASTSGPRASASAAVPERGERVIVEPTAAEFFEARVLEVNGDRVRVQMLGASGDARTVSIADVHRVKPPSARLEVGSFVICKAAAGWSACRVEVVADDGKLEAVTAEGARSSVARADVIAPSQVTELNVKRRFERAQERADFNRDLVRAGAPVPRAGWKPGPSEAVLARLDAGWFGGSVHELGKKEIRIAWQGSDRVSEVPPSALIPAPPYAGPFHRGFFALVRPVSASAPWQPMRIESVAENEIVVRDAVGNKRSVAAGDLVPLAAEKK